MLKLNNLPLFILFIILVGLMQNSGLLSIYGINPSISMVALIILIPFVSFYDYLILILTAGIVLHAPIGFITVVLAAYFGNHFLPWRQSINNLILIISATLIFYLFISPSFLYHNFYVVLGEISYNLILGLAFYLAIRRGDKNHRDDKNLLS